MVRETILSLLAAREPYQSICPSEVARRISPHGNWRDAMTEVHVVVDRLVSEGIINLSWKGKLLPTRSGPYRISLSVLTSRSPDV
mgnify:CR=1 FL=1